MDKLNRYIGEQYSADKFWFVEEVRQAYHISRISKVINNKNYINGLHKILEKEDVFYKGVEFNVSKMTLATIKTICSFHKTYLLGKRVSLSGSDNMVKKYEQLYRKGKFHKTNFSVIDSVIKYGDAFEYVYYSDGKVTSRIIASEDSYPIYNDKMEYIGFIEYYCDLLSNVEYYTVFYPNKVEQWSNEGGTLHLVDEKTNISGLPIHYKNTDELFGESIIDDLKPVLDKIEILVNRMDDSIYTMSLNPISYVSGQAIDSSVDAEAIGWLLNLEDGATFNIESALLDSASIKLLLDTLWQNLWTIAQVPSIVMGQSNIANVSEVSLKLLYSLANNKAMEHEVYMRDGMDSRHEIIQSVLKYRGIEFSDDNYVDVEFNYSRPTDDS